MHTRTARAIIRDIIYYLETMLRAAKLPARPSWLANAYADNRLYAKRSTR